MDTLSSSVSTFKIPSRIRHPKSQQLVHHFNSHHIPPQHLISSTSNPKSGSSNSIASRKATAVTPNNPDVLITPLPYVNSPLSPNAGEETLSIHHEKAASGYAVALLDVARCNNVLERVERDVKRLYKWILGVELMKLEKREIILKEMLKRGMFSKHLVKLVKLLVGKTKLEILNQVLVEFQRIYDELTATAQVLLLVSPGNSKSEKDQIFGIAKRVQNMCGGAIKVNITQFVGKQLSSVAM